MNSKKEYALIERMMMGDFDPDQPRDENGRWTDTGASGDFKGSAYHDPKTGIKINGKGEIEGPPELVEGAKHPGKPGENIKVGGVVQYAPDSRSPGEEKYVHVVLEKRSGGRYLISTYNTSLSLGSTETVGADQIQSLNYNVAEKNRKVAEDLLLRVDKRFKQSMKKMSDKEIMEVLNRE